MTAEATLSKDTSVINQITPAAGYSPGEVIQLADGRAGVLAGLAARVSGDMAAFATRGQFTIAKTTGIVILDGGKVYWDHSANTAHFKAVNDRDFYVGTAVGDAASADTSLVVNLNVETRYLLDLARDPFTSVLAGTAAAGGLSYPYRRGGAHGLRLTATNEAQAVDALSNDGFATGALAIVEMRVNVIDDGAGAAADFNVGIASGTHATDADSIAQHLFLHYDANALQINFQSKDGTTTVAATDSTLDNVQGTFDEVWFDCRDTSNVKIYVNGVRVLAATTFKIVGSASTWKLLAHLEKTSSTDVYDGQVDWLRVRTMQQSNAA